MSEYEDAPYQTRDDIEREIVPDERLWRMSVDDILELDTTTGMSAERLVLRKMRLMAEAADYLALRVRKAQRKLARCQRRIEALLIGVERQ